MSARTDKIKALLEAAFSPESIEIEDDSHLHAGHAGAKGGAGHYRLTIIAESFAGRHTVARHRLVYAALASMMPGEIHALQINAYTPDEL